jgi:hypothetical protein
MYKIISSSYMWNRNCILIKENILICIYLIYMLACLSTVHCSIFRGRVWGSSLLFFYRACPRILRFLWHLKQIKSGFTQAASIPDPWDKYSIEPVKFSLFIILSWNVLGIEQQFCSWYVLYICISHCDISSCYNDLVIK